ncbi:hypothetical protein E4U55_003309 [Claviceps digitariae]|nr:hypothetical protein E4U55_003309 [Claviceps digitariae]
MHDPNDDDEQMKDDEATPVEPHQAADANEATSPSTPKIAFDFCAYQSDNHSSSDDASHAQASAAALEHATSQFRRGYKVEVSIPALPLESRQEYEESKSNIVERVCSLDYSSGGEDETVEVEFTDGTLRKITLAQIERFENGLGALDTFFENMGQSSRKRKMGPNEDWQSGSSSDESDIMDLDQAEEDMAGVAVQRQTRTRSSGSHHNAQVGPKSKPHDSDDSDILLEQPRRSSRKRQTRFPNPQVTPRAFSDQEDDDDGFTPVVSDITTSHPNAKRRSARASKLRTKGRSQLSRTRGSHDSEIEFEAPRRSGRATRDVRYSQDLADIDDEVLFRIDSGPQEPPRVVSVKEVFRPTPPESRFATVHMNTCYTCKSTNIRGQIVYCQGCSFAYHKQCIGPRSAREHLATKVGEADFVLQCRFCIEHQQKKETTAPRRSKCQSCMESGHSCAPFSKRQTARQEEKLREQNGGVDPWTPVKEELLNNADNVLFRCGNCRRAWHQHHLPSIGCESPRASSQPSQGQTFGALKDYSIDWQCNECTSAQQKIHRLVAWRTRRPPTKHAAEFMQLTDDEKEYLVKWDTMSYSHCTWMPGAWIYGVVAAATRNSFAKRATEVDLFKLSAKEAIPEEYLMIDIILRVKLSPTAIRGSSLEEDETNISHISKMLVKFQGLGYDDVVWDTPPSKDSGDLYTAFELAYQDYLAGKHFQHSSSYKIKERIREFRNNKHEEIAVQPAGLKRGKLMGYQIEGLNWLVSNYHNARSVILADEMGLGKTVQVVSLVTYLVQESPKCWPFLISVPNATCPNWRREFRQWAPDLRVVTYHGGKEPQDLAYKYELFPSGSRDMAAHVVIMSYDSTQDPRTRELFNSVRWAGLVVDEGQRLKNDRNLLYQALRAMKIPFRLLLTGTPLQNNKRELFNLIQFIDQTKNAEQLDLDFAILDKETLPKLHEMIRPYFLRRTKAGVLKFLPPMAQIILPVTMTVIQEKLSRSIMAKNPQLIKAIFANGKVGRKDRGSLNNILVQLRKCLCHPFMYSEAIEEKHDNPDIIHRNLVEASAKLLLLEVMLPKLKERGHRVLIFSQFLQQLDIMEDFLNGIGYDFRRLDGQISSLEKQRRIDAFNAPDSPIFAFLLSTRAGGVGINLATADTVIIMDPDFNPHQDIQALSRAHRIGQKRKVLCFQLMTKDTVEERIMQIGKKKMALDHALIESMDDEDLAGDDLESILKHGAQALFADDYQKGAITYDGPSVDKLLDRSDVEQTKMDEEGSAEAQFSYAKVWANDKAALEDGLTAAAEDLAPEPVSSSVWDKILAQREEEARRQAAAKQETLGRGGRRRTTNNYKNDVLAEYLQDVDGPNQSDSSSDNYAGADGGADEESSSDEDLAHQGKTRKTSPNKAKGAQTSPSPSKQAKKTAKDIDQSAQQQQKQTPTKSARQRAPPTPTPSRTPQPSSKSPKRHRVAKTGSKAKAKLAESRATTSPATKECQRLITTTDNEQFISPQSHELLRSSPQTAVALPQQSALHDDEILSTNQQHWNAEINHSVANQRFVRIDHVQPNLKRASTSASAVFPLLGQERNPRLRQSQAELLEQLSESNIRLTMDTIVHSRDFSKATKAQHLATLKDSLQRASRDKQQPNIKQQQQQQPKR